jgi:hypothetical protein
MRSEVLNSDAHHLAGSKTLEDALARATNWFEESRRKLGGNPLRASPGHFEKVPFVVERDRSFACAVVFQPATAPASAIALN